MSTVRIPAVRRSQPPDRTRAVRASLIRNAGTWNATIANFGTVGGQTVTVNNADRVTIVGETAGASIFSNGTQSLTIQGAGQNLLEVQAAEGAFWLLLDLEARTATWQRAPYDLSPVRARARALGLDDARVAESERDDRGRRAQNRV